jgi:hypothetical protein
MRAIIVFDEDIHAVDVTPSSQVLKPTKLDEYLLQKITTFYNAFRLESIIESCILPL